MFFKCCVDALPSATVNGPSDRPPLGCTVGVLLEAFDWYSYDESAGCFVLLRDLSDSDVITLRYVMLLQYSNKETLVVILAARSDGC